MNVLIVRDDCYHCETNGALTIVIYSSTYLYYIFFFFFCKLHFYAVLAGCALALELINKWLIYSLAAAEGFGKRGCARTVVYSPHICILSFKICRMPVYLAGINRSAVLFLVADARISVILFSFRRTTRIINLLLAIYMGN